MLCPRSLVDWQSRVNSSGLPPGGLSNHFARDREVPATEAMVEAAGLEAETPGCQVFQEAVVF